MSKRMFEVRLLIPAEDAYDAIRSVTPLPQEAPVEGFVGRPYGGEDRYLYLGHGENAYWSEQPEPKQGPLGEFASEGAALEECRRRNRMVAGPYGGTCAHATLWVACEGLGPGEWSVITVEDAIEGGFDYKWVA